MKELEILGYKVLLDDEDYERVHNLSWWLDKKALVKHGHVYFEHSFRDHGKQYKMYLHRFILGLKLHDGIVCDHINGDTLDNQKKNLRKCTTAENCRNARIHKDNQTGYKGVAYNKEWRYYSSRIQVNKQNIYLGSFKTAEDAYEAYCDASKKYHGEFGRTK